MQGRTYRAVALALVAAAALLLGVVPATALAGAEQVIATKADEYKPAASADYVVWNVWDGKHAITYAKAFGGPRVRVSQRGWSGYPGAIDGTELIYQQYRGGDKAASGILLYDLITGDRTRLPSPVNTAAWEYAPSMSGDNIVFARWRPSGDRTMYLYDRVTQAIRTIAETTGVRRLISKPQVNGDNAAYQIVVTDHDGNWTSCEVYRYALTNQSTTKIPNPSDRCQYAPSVDATGTVYYARGGFRCGVHISLTAYPIGGPPSTVLALPDGQDTYGSYAVDNIDGSVSLYFDHGTCGKQHDVARVTLPAPVPIVLPRAAAGTSSHGRSRPQPEGVDPTRS